MSIGSQPVSTVSTAAGSASTSAHAAGQSTTRSASSRKPPAVHSASESARSRIVVPPAPS